MIILLTYTLVYFSIYSDSRYGLREVNTFILKLTINMEWLIAALLIFIYFFSYFVIFYFPMTSFLFTFFVMIYWDCYFLFYIFGMFFVVAMGPHKISYFFFHFKLLNLLYSYKKTLKI